MAAASSLQTRPSHNARIAPSTQPSMHCGPPIAAMISGIVMNGPTPTMLLMLSAVASSVPKLRTRPLSSFMRGKSIIRRSRRVDSAAHDLAEDLSAALLAAPGSRVLTAIEQNSRGVSAHTGNRQIGHCDDWCVSRPLDHHGHGDRNFVSAILNPRMDEP